MNVKLVLRDQFSLTSQHRLNHDHTEWVDISGFEFLQALAE